PTHHLLEQAFKNLASEVGQIGEPREQLHVRMVSGTLGHSDVADIKPQDDVIIATLQTITRAYANNHPNLLAWLDAAGDRLAIVFDEAHHAPAYSYRSLLLKLRERQPGLYLLGLTATPVYGGEGQGGWLARLFPDGILFQTTAQKLMAAGVLAQPVFEEYATNVTVQFDEREYKKWLGTYRDLPEDIVSQLALNRERNQFIASTYVQQKERYGKTIIFVDRWYQCEQLREMLVSRGVRADVIYSHVTIEGGGPEQRNRRTSDDNHKVLERFKQGEIDVLINVRMLTEGTDVPDVETVFLTRQTTSHVLITQMIGRALRGQRFGGTAQAYVVSFVDNWKHLINWAEYTLYDGETADTMLVPVRRPPVHLISIALVRDLARKMDQGLVINIDPFQTMLPVGWYRADYLARVEGTDDLETVIQLAMVFEHEQEAYPRWMAALTAADLQPFADEQVQLADQRDQLDDWRARFFAEAGEGLGDDLSLNLFHLARHLAAHEGQAPPFFVFDERTHHDLDQIAAQLIDRPLSSREKLASLEAEYRRSDRYWSVLYPNFLFFKSQYDACENRLLIGAQPLPADAYSEPEFHQDREPSQEVKDQVLARDGYRCLSCGEDTRHLLQIDHVAPYYLGGRNSLGNLQTLCRVCNNHKGISEINFRHNETMLNGAPTQFPVLEPPEVEQAARPEAWRRFLRRSVNFFYRCAAVADVQVGDTAEATWSIQLWANNDPQWLEPFLGTLLQQVQARRFEGGALRPATLTVGAPDRAIVSVTAAAPIAQTVIAPVLPDLAIATTRQLQIISTASLPLARPGQRLNPLATARHRETYVAASLLAPDQPLLAVTNVGRAYMLASGSTNAPPDLPSLRPEEQIRLLSSVPDDRVRLDAVVLTGAGQIKRRFLNGLLPSTVRGHLITATGTEIVGIDYTSAAADLLVVTAWGYAIRFAAKDVPMQEDNAAGVQAVQLNSGDAPVALVVVEPEMVGRNLVIITEAGMAKRTLLNEYRTQGRNGIGVQTSSVGGIVAACLATAEDEIILLSKKGKAARLAVASIPQRGRATVGNHLISLDSDDQLISALVVPGAQR
ncbi:MAG: DEAD/DEAH box helicase family protein, partial [Oscillochloris sp.]|nr:DEAD/DEAH box helicase family protein [Oscillochloris sp.]